MVESLAQEEIRSISENVNWRQRKRFADGKVSLPHGRFLGYEKGTGWSAEVLQSEMLEKRLISRAVTQCSEFKGYWQNM